MMKREQRPFSKLVSALWVGLPTAVFLIMGWVGISIYWEVRQETAVFAEQLAVLATRQVESDLAEMARETAVLPLTTPIQATASPPSLDIRPKVAAKPKPASPTPTNTSFLSPIFSKEIHAWTPSIKAWAAQHNLDPDIIATLMQIESCGNPLVRSAAGAMGLFQVMPHHFTAGENMVDPNTNAKRGLDYFNLGLVWHNGDVLLTFAGYNAGHGIAARDWSAWPQETRSYLYWSKGIYGDAKAGLTISPTLNEWMQAKGNFLCQQAAIYLGI